MPISGRTWVFGYGSLVSPASLARTIGRTVDPAERSAVHVAGFGRRWNYGSLHLRGDWVHDGREVTGGLVVSLGVVEAAGEVCNGTIVAVDDEELAALDWRERDYERTDITDHVTLDADGAGTADGGNLTLDADGPGTVGSGNLTLDADGAGTVGSGNLTIDGPIVTYVPRPSAIERYLAARDSGTAAIRASYWTLVHDAFDRLGPDHRAVFDRTPAPDVPVADITLHPH